jgi:hypothetical protein
MDDPVPCTKKPGRPEGGKTRGRGDRKNSRLVVNKRKGIKCNKKQAEVIAEPNENYDESSSSEVATEFEAPNIVEDESDSEIEHRDEEDADGQDAGDDNRFIEFVEERSEPVFQTET